MELQDFEEQIVSYLEDKFNHSIDKDDPLLLSISAQVKTSEHLLNIHRANMEKEFEVFRMDLEELLKGTTADIQETKRIVGEHIKKTFLVLTDTYKETLSAEFLKAGEEYMKSYGLFKKIKFWALSFTIMNTAIVLIGVFLTLYDLI